MELSNNAFIVIMEHLLLNVEWSSSEVTVDLVQE